MKSLVQCLLEEPDCRRVFKKIFFYFKLKDNCFTGLCWFLPNINMNQPSVYIQPLLHEPPSHLPPNPTPLAGEINILDFRLQSYSHQESMVLAQKQKYRPMEQDRKPKDQPMQLRLPYF